MDMRKGKKMSKRLIYAEDAITVLQRCYCGIEVKRKRPVTENERFFYFDVLQGLEDLPSAQPKRMKGRWEVIEDWDGDDLYRCSECGSMFTLIDGTPEDNDYNFCPSCGADMKGEDDETD